MPAQSRSLTRSILHTLATIVSAQGVGILAGIVTARAYGPAGKGIISYTTVTIAFAVAAAEGLRNVIAFQVGNQNIALNAVWKNAMRLFALIVAIGVVFFVALWLNDRSQPAFLVVAIVFPFAFYLQISNMLFMLRHAIERMNVQNAVTIGVGSAIAVIVAVTIFHANVTTVLVITTISYIVAALWAAIGVGAFLRDAKHEDSVPSSFSEQASFAIKGGASAIVTLLALRVDIFIVGSTQSRIQLGVYTTAVALAEILLVLSRSVTWATTGRVATETRERAIALTARTLRSIVVAQAVAAVAMGIAAPFAISLFYGSRFTASGPLLAILLPRVVFYSADLLLANFIIVRQGRPGVQFAFEAATLLICATATWFAIGRFGVMGAATAATTTFVLAFLAKLAYFVRISGQTWSEIIVLRREDLPHRVRTLWGRVQSRTS